MNATIDPVADKIAHVNARRKLLEDQARRIGRPAANRLLERLEALSPPTDRVAALDLASASVEGAGL